MDRENTETHRITWRGIALDITFTPEAFIATDHIEIRTEGRVSLPVTETGYRSHFVPTGSVEAYGGAAAFVTAWLDHKAARTGWSGAQLSLF